MHEFDVLLLAFNEIDTLPDEIEMWKSICLKKGGKIIVSEDGSNDGTAEYLSDLHDRKEILHCTANFRRGYKKAFLDGMRSTTAPRVIFADTGSKFSFPDILSAIDKDANVDVLIGNRRIRHDGYVRRVLTIFYNLFAASLFGRKIARDLDSGFRIYSGRARDYIKSNEFRFPELVSSEINIRLFNAGFSVDYVDMEYFDRETSSRSFSYSKLVRTSLASFGRLIRLKVELK
jgi:glycosyltransferase involved in cell wall biosynthesis